MKFCLKTNEYVITQNESFVPSNISPFNGREAKSGPLSALFQILFLVNDSVSHIALTIATKSSATREAPPISPPSTSGFPKISSALPGFTLPP